MQRVSPVDAAWLALESRDTPMHVGGLFEFTLRPDAPGDYLKKEFARMREPRAIPPPWNLRLVEAPVVGKVPLRRGPASAPRQRRRQGRRRPARSPARRDPRRRVGRGRPVAGGARPRARRGRRSGAAGAVPGAGFGARRPARWPAAIRYAAVRPG